MACAFLARVLRIAGASLEGVLSGTQPASLRSYSRGSYKPCLPVWRSSASSKVGPRMTTIARPEWSPRDDRESRLRDGLSLPLVRPAAQVAWLSCRFRDTSSFELRTERAGARRRHRPFVCQCRRQGVAQPRAKIGGGRPGGIGDLHIALFWDRWRGPVCAQRGCFRVLFACGILGC